MSDKFQQEHMDALNALRAGVSKEMEVKINSFLDIQETKNQAKFKDIQEKANKAEEFNKKESNTKYGKAGVGALKSVFQRGLGAYNTQRSPRVTSAKQWALARVNAFLYLLKNGRPQNAGYTTDYDLLPKGHPKAE